MQTLGKEKLNMDKKRKGRGKKLLSWLLTAAIVLGLVSPAAVEAADKASSSTNVVQNDVYVDIKKTLEDANNGLFKLTIDASSYIKKEYQTYTQSYSEDGYYVIEEDGYYLVELWGGNGGEGEDANSSFSDHEGGDGGNAGYVYGYMYLEAGQTLLFTIGTDGVQSTQGSGGGANEGGDHQSFSLYKVGGGGGYSSVHLLDSERTVYFLTEEERINNYIMIAGGGGGGGAASNALTETVGKPNGGNGGHIQSSLSGHLTAEDNGVAGTYFVGEDGKSSGTSTKYVGRGGTNVPGKMPTSWDGWTGVILPNDWTGTYNDDWYNENTEYAERNTEPGGGGMGAMRGGAGGAGFCGGSGGFQASILLSSNVGGGGGGSSFIADSVTYRDMPEDVRHYLNESNYSGVGGSCVVTFLGEKIGEDPVDTSHMRDVDITGTISSYFDIVSASTSKNGDVKINGQTITVEGADISPDDRGYRDKQLKLEIYVKAKDGFAGGNNVPVIGSDFKLTPVNHATITAKANANTDYANVPLDFEAIGNSYMSNEPGKSYSVSSLYTDNYTAYRTSSALRNDWRYNYIGSISTYSVKQGSTTVSGTVSPTKTTDYTVQFTVTPYYTNAAVVGDAIPSSVVFSDKATITIVSSDAAGTLNGLDIDATKMLSHDGENYQFDLNVNQKSKEINMPTATTKITDTGEGSWKAPQDGWYYIQAWGGNGQGSGASHVGQTTNLAHGVGRRGQGGAGGYVSGYVYLQQGEIITYVVGESPNSGITASATCNKSLSDCHNEINYYTRDGHTADSHTANTGSGQAHGTRTSGGAGGKFTRLIAENGTTLLIAGGGGGAGGSAASASSSGTKTREANGTTGRTNSTVSTTLESDSAYNGSSGTSGSYQAEYSFWGSTITATAGSAGAAGSNYRYSAVASGYDTSGSGYIITESAKLYASDISTTKSNGKNGQITITLLETDETEAQLNKLYGLSASGTFSRYFDVEAIDMKTTITGTSSTVTTNADGSKTVIYKKSNEEVARFTYKLVEKEDGTTDWSVYDTKYIPETVLDSQTETGYNMHYESKLDFVISLKPKDGFLGGNDVPLVQYETTGNEDTGVKISQLDGSLWLNKKNISDYANVEIAYEFDAANFMTQNKTITCGEAVNQTDLITVNEIPLPTGEEAWKAEFVKAVYPVTETVYPTENTTYSFTQKVAPLTDAQKAVVIDSVEADTMSRAATVYIEYTVTTDLEHMTYSGPDKVADGDVLTAQVEAESGYLLPDTISVSVGGSTLNTSAYTYDKETGRIEIPQESITGNVHITADAVVQTFDLWYVYDVNGDGKVDTSTEKVLEGKFVAGASLDNLPKLAEITAGIPAKTGYTFTWDWQTTDGKPRDVMPAADVYVYGDYQKNLYNLTIHYVNELDESIADDYVTQVPFESDYSVVSPNVEGYLAEQPIVSGTMSEAEDVVITVRYEKTAGKLTIIYLYEDSKETAGEPYEQSIEIDTEYSITSPDIAGYTADIPVVEGKVTGSQADNGITVYVYYQPNQYTVTFDADGGTIAETDKTKTVVYNNIYGYDPTAPEGEQYSGLPQPIKTGYDFEGWVDENGKTVDEESLVQIAGNHTLKAKWKGHKFKITVHYQYSDGTKAADSYETNVEYGEKYSIESPKIEGYTPAPEVKGTMGAGNRVITVIYSIDQHTINISYIGPNGEPMSEIDSTAVDYSVTQDYGTEYSKESPVVAGYELDEEKNGEDLTTVSGIVGTEDLDINVYYKYIDYSVTVNYVLTEGPGIQPEPTIIEGLHIGETYEVESPVISGYTVDKTTVSGTVGTEDVIITVNYAPNQHTLKIKYIYDENVIEESLRGTEAYAEYTEKIKYGSEYNILNPTVTGYKTMESSVSGTMPDGDVEVIVHYFDQETVVIMYKPNNDALGSVEPEYEVIKIDETSKGAIATAKTGSRFVGWYKDINGIEAVDSSWIDENGLFKPVVQTEEVIDEETGETVTKYLDETYFAIFEQTQMDVKISVFANGSFANKSKKFTGKLSTDSTESENPQEYSLSDTETATYSVIGATKMWLSDIETGEGYNLTVEYKAPGSEEWIVVNLSDSASEEIETKGGIAEIRLTYQKDSVINTGIGDGTFSPLITVLAMVEVILILMMLVYVSKYLRREV